MAMGYSAKLIREHADKEFKAWFDALERVSFHKCMHGGTRAKRSRLFATRGLNCSLSWKRSATTPMSINHGVLLGITRACVLIQLWKQNIYLYYLADFIDLPRGFTQQVLGRQIRRRLGQHVKHGAPLVAEFSYIVENGDLSQPGARALSSQLHGLSSEMIEQNEMSEEQEGPVQPPPETEQSPPKKAKLVQQVGFQRTPEQFFEDAMKTQHPMAPQSLLPEVLKGAIMENLTREPLQLAKERMKQIFKIRKMAQELDPEETKLKAQLQPEVARVLAPKRVLLWEKRLQVSQYQDMGIVEMVKRGIPLHGEHDYPRRLEASYGYGTGAPRWSGVEKVCFAVVGFS